MRNKIFPDQRKNGKFVIIEFVGHKNSGTATRIWPRALRAPRRPIYFESYREAQMFIKEKTT